MRALEFFPDWTRLDIDQDTITLDTDSVEHAEMKQRRASRRAADMLHRAQSAFAYMPPRRDA